MAVYAERVKMAVKPVTSALSQTTVPLQQHVLPAVLKTEPFDNIDVHQYVYELILCSRSSATQKTAPKAAPSPPIVDDELITIEDEKEPEFLARRRRVNLPEDSRGQCTWTSAELAMLQKGLQIFSRDPCSIALFVGTKSCAQVSIILSLRKRA